MDAELKGRLDRIEQKLDALLEDAGLEEVVATCPRCDGDSFVEDSAFGEQTRRVCQGCGLISEE